MPDHTPPAVHCATTPTQPRRQGSVLDVFWAFLRLGVTSFGGPVAHIGYFRTEFVERRQWLDDLAYSDLVALSQFLPGPASSKVGMALGLDRAGVAGCIAAWVGFTLPSAVALILFALGLAQYQDLASSGIVQGLKVVAVAVVAQAVWGMAKSLCTDRLRAGLAIFAAILTLVLPSSFGQIAAIVVCGGVGLWRLAPVHRATISPRHGGLSKTTGAVCLTLFFLLLVGLPLWAANTTSPLIVLAAGFYKAGALVFGGGHVILPLLETSTVAGGFVTPTEFLAGYGATQAVPGPLFTFAAFLGTIARSPIAGWMGGLFFLLMVFLPAFLLVLGALPFWETLRRRAGVQTALAGINAGVVGILLSALYNPVWTSAIHAKADFGLALASFGLLVYARFSPVLVVFFAASVGWLLVP